MLGCVVTTVVYSFAVTRYAQTAGITGPTKLMSQRVMKESMKEWPTNVSTEATKITFRDIVVVLKNPKKHFDRVEFSN